LVPAGDEDAALLDRLRPILRYDSQGSFQADSPAVLTDRIAAGGDVANALKRADGTVVAAVSGGRRRAKLDLGFLGWPEYGDGTKAARSDFLDAVGRDYVQQAREMHRPPYADRIYGHIARDDDGGRYLQYWLFYLFNNKAFLGLGLHEGDWEMVQIKLNAQGEPEAMAFAQHDHGQRCAWRLVDKLGVRPIVYVARGSQASFPRPGRHDAPVIDDVADGKGREVSPTLEVLSEGSPAWVRWPGRWGSTKARNRLESNSPRGPAQHGQWDDPMTFDEEADEFDPRRMAPGPAPPAPHMPTISVRRERDRAVIAYRFPKPTVGHPAPVQLVVSIEAEADELPPATYAFAVEQRAGELEHPLELEEGPYRVLVSAADAAGHSSETASAGLP
jgi:hypothetical protein